MYAGTCDECDEHYTPGTPIRRVGQQWVHEKCPEIPGLQGDICGTCFQERSTSGACGCVS
jgi:hypothetical protein